MKRRVLLSLLCILVLFSVCGCDAVKDPGDMKNIPLEAENGAVPICSFSFNNIVDAEAFYNAKRQYINENYVLLDTTKIASGVNNVLQSSYALLFDNDILFVTGAELSEKLSNPRFITYLSFYSEQLGSVARDKDVLNHSVTLKCYSYGCTGDLSKLRFTFSQYENDKFMWNNVVMICDGDQLVSVMYYYADVQVSEQWMENFIKTNVYCLGVK